MPKKLTCAIKSEAATLRFLENHSKQFQAKVGAEEKERERDNGSPSSFYIIRVT